MQHRLGFIIVWLICTFFAQAQIPIPEGVPTIKGYDIIVNDAQREQQTFYLLGWYNGESYLLDSARINKGIARFKNSKTILPCGSYFISDAPILRPNLKDFPIDIILNQSNKAIVTRTQNSVSVQDNTESEIVNRFYNNILREESLDDATLFSTLMQALEETSPNAFVTRYLHTIQGLLVNAPVEEDFEGWSYLLRQLPHIDFNEPRLLYTINPLATMLKTNIEGYYCTNSDSLIMFADSILHQCKHPIVRNYYLRLLFTSFDVHNPDYDPVLVHLYDTYGQSWIEEGRENSYKRKVNNLRKIIPGAPIPELIAYDKDGNAQSTNNISSQFTVLWFWDPDCDHCQEMTPVLHTLYQKHATDWNFEVFAVEVNEDHDRWIAFSDQHNLWDWLNLSTSMGEANLDFIEYFDIMTTPVIFLIDNHQKHTIIKRQITLNELQDFFMNNNK